MRTRGVDATAAATAAARLLLAEFLRFRPSVRLFPDTIFFLPRNKIVSGKRRTLESGFRRVTGGSEFRGLSEANDPGTNVIGQVGL